MMYEVTNIEKKKNKYQVQFKYQDKHLDFEVSDELILEYRLVRGKILEKPVFNGFKEAVQHDTYRQKLMHYATYKPRTISECRKYLEQFSIPEKAKDKYIKKLVDVQILNDELYVKNYIDEYSHFRMIGPKKIEFDLIQKGLSRTLINQYISDYSHQLMKENIETLVEKKLKSSKNKPIFKIKESLKAYVVNKGYDYGLTQEVIDSLSKRIEEEIDEDASLQKDYDNYLRKYKKGNQSQSFREFAIPKLIQKGYSYHKIIDILKGEGSDEY